MFLNHERIGITNIGAKYNETHFRFIQLCHLTVHVSWCEGAIGPHSAGVGLKAYQRRTCRSFLPFRLQIRCPQRKPTVVKDVLEGASYDIRS